MADKKEVDKTSSCNFSLYNSQIKQIEEYLNRTKKFRTVSSFFQHLVDNFFNKSKGSLIKNFMLYTGYPLVIVVIMLYVARSTQNIESALLTEGYFLSVLHDQSMIFLVIGFLWLGITAATTYAFMLKIRKG